MKNLKKKNPSVAKGDLRDPVSPKARSRVIVVMPAYNAEKTLRKTHSDIPKGWVDEVILVDDCSRDKTIKVAKKLGIKTFVHLKNKGYGANQKTCYTEALKLDPGVVVMLHPDYQYDPKYIPEMVAPIASGHSDIMLGSRMISRKEVLAGGMPFYKYISNRFLTLIENIVLGRSLSEYHTGYRAYSRRALECIPFLNNSDDFVFDSELLIQSAYYDLKIGEVFVSTKYFPEASMINFRRSAKYGIQTLWTLFKYILAKTKLYRAKIFRKK